jgi:hypothetical protein
MSAVSPAPRGCERCHAALEQGDLRCAICATAVPHLEAQANTQIEVELLRCDGCGAAVRYDVKAQAPRCSFCDSVMHVEKVEDPMEQTNWWGEFQVEPQAAGQALSQWLSSLGFFRPSDLTSRASIEGLKPLWWVAWVFDATAMVSWTADSDAGSQRSAWAPHAGQIELTFERIVVPASRGLSDKETEALIPGYALDQGTTQEPQRQDAIVEQFDVQRSEARGRILDAAEAVAASRVQAGAIPGSRFRNVHVELVLRGLQTRRCAFPAYVLAYRYRNKLYRAVINGQSDTFMTGNAPYSLWKITATIVAGIAVVAAVIALVSG